MKKVKDRRKINYKRGDDKEKEEMKKENEGTVGERDEKLCSSLSR